MKAIVRKVQYDGDKMLRIEPSDLEHIIVLERSLLAIDGSTTRSGVSIIGIDKKIKYVIALERDSSNETPIQYKVQFKRFLDSVMERNRAIETIYYEEPFIEYIESSKVLLSLRTSVEEIIAERAPKYDYIKFIEASNQKWKSQFLAPDKVPAGKPAQKAAVTNKVYKLYPLLADEKITEDECDSLGLGLVALGHSSSKTEDSLKSKKKARAFNYNIRFIGANDEDEMFNELTAVINTYKIPQSLVDSYLEDPDIIELNGRGLFNNLVYEHMGTDDKLLILAFRSDKYSNVILEHRMAALTKESPMIYAVVWRKTRKK